MNKELDDGDRQLKPKKNTDNPIDRAMPREARKNVQRDHRKLRKEITNLERKIAQLDDKKRELNTSLLTETKPMKPSVCTTKSAPFPKS
jgi:ATP-binding cassette subfamily F protein 3